ncbi:MAG: hypothetical protein J6Y19_03930 [Kiritimatiellae bacterium]|nr:hypothetical protein [Kiritimatiellia bacterium]
MNALKVAMENRRYFVVIVESRFHAFSCEARRLARKKEACLAAHGQTRIKAQKAKASLHVFREVVEITFDETQREASARALPLQRVVI